MPGALEKMRIYAYNDPELSEQHRVGLPFVALVNPESYTIEKRMEFNFSQGQGTTGAQSRFELKPPEEMSFEFLFDNTGIIDYRPTVDLSAQLDKFTELLMGYDGSTHEPKFFKLVWGTLMFKGRCTALNIAYKLFNPDGAPIRAVCRVTFKEFREEQLRVASEDSQSPDLTHVRVVRAGDTLPLLCFRVYGDARHYIEVARANGLSGFRNLRVGDSLRFPPFAKNGAS